jgi:hypothetical protein
VNEGYTDPKKKAPKPKDPRVSAPPPTTLCKRSSGFWLATTHGGGGVGTLQAWVPPEAQAWTLITSSGDTEEELHVRRS